MADKKKEGMIVDDCESDADLPPPEETETRRKQEVEEEDGEDAVTVVAVVDSGKKQQPDSSWTAGTSGVEVVVEATI